MTNARWLMTIGVLLVTACAGSQPEPRQAVVQANADIRSAEQFGQADPRAQLHLRIAKDELARAQDLMASGENVRAETMLARASADAELALLLSRATVEETEAERVKREVDAARSRLER